MERRDRSLILAMRRQARAAGSGSGARWSLFVSFADGMQVLVDALVRRLPEGAVRFATRATAVEADPTGSWRVTLAGGASLRAAGVIVATPAFAAAELLRGVDHALAMELAAIPYASSATVTLGYARADVPHPLDGFGFVVPAIEGRNIIAGSFSSVKYAGRAPEGQALIRVFFSGAAVEDPGSDADTLVASARHELRELLGITAAPRLARAHRYPRSMPQYRVGHLARVAAIETALARHPGLALAGNAYRGVGLPDCIRSGELAAERLLAARGRRDSVLIAALLNKRP
jgi:oxygen-dependent protoporphyrinogen oxidase